MHAGGACRQGWLRRKSVPAAHTHARCLRIHPPAQLAGALFSLALEIEFIVESPITGWTAWLSCISAASCAVCAIVVLAFQACRGTPRAPPQSPLGTMMCGIGLFWNAILLVCFVGKLLLWRAEADLQHTNWPDVPRYRYCPAQFSRAFALAHALLQLAPLALG